MLQWKRSFDALEMLEDHAKMILVHEMAEEADTVSLPVRIRGIDQLQELQLLLGLPQPAL